MIKGVLFDLDGVLWLSRKGHEAGYLESLKEYKVNQSNLLEANYFGRATSDVIAEVLSAKKISFDHILLENLVNKKRSISNDFLKEVRPVNMEIIKDFDLLKQKGLKIGIVTSSSRQNLELFLTSLTQKVIFDVLVSIEEVSNPKPAPDVYLLAIKKLNSHPSDLIAVEDTNLGKSAANNAGVKCYLYRSEFDCENKFRWPNILKEILINSE
jgi:beta-phosphoglucomutase